MLLKNKNAIIYGAGGSIGSTVARAFAKQGANLFLTGRNLVSVQKTASLIIDSGDKAEAAVVDALDEKAVNNHMDTVVSKAGSVDIVFNAIGLEDTQNIPLTKMSLADFLRPVTIAMNTQFITSTAAGRAMMKQGKYAGNR